MKYIDADKLLAEIERRIIEHKKSLKKDITLISEAMLKGSLGAYESTKRFITSLQQEQPDVDLDVEIANYLNKNVLNRINNSDIIEDFTTMEAGELASYFYELGINARNKD